MKSMNSMLHVLWIIAKTKPKKNDVELLSLLSQFAIQICPICFVIGQKFLAVRQRVAKINTGKAVRLTSQGIMENVFVMRVLFCSMANVSRKMSAAVSCRAVTQFQMDGTNYHVTVRQNAFVKIMNISVNQTIVILQAMTAW